MTTYVLLRIGNDDEAASLVRDMNEWPDSELLTPCQENRVHATVVDVITVPGDTAHPESKDEESRGR